MMFGVQGLGLCLGVCALFFSGCQAGYSSNPPVYVWPLGGNIVGLELNTHVRECDSSNLAYDAGPATLNYSAIEFAREGPSYVDIPIGYDTKLDGDTSFSFHIYPETDGTFFHYKSDNTTDVGLAEIKITFASGDFVTSLSSSDGSFSNGTTSLSLLNGTWGRIVAERDTSNERVKFYAESPSASVITETTFNIWLKNMKTIFPGKLRLGGSQDGGSFFTGRLACLQLVDTKDPNSASEYDAECMQQNWPTTTIATTVPATCGAVTTTPTNTPTSTPATTIPLTTQAPPALHSFVPAISSMDMGCSHFAATPGATYQSLGDVLQTMVMDLRECVWLCVLDGACGSFLHSGGVCQTGISSPSLVGDAGKTMYVLQ